MSSGGASNAAVQVKTTYHTVIDDVVKGVRELFLNDGVDEQVLSDLKEVWEAKLEESGVMNHPSPPKNKPQGESSSKHFPQQQSWNIHHQQQQHSQPSHSQSAATVSHHHPSPQQQQLRRQQQQQPQQLPPQQSTSSVGVSHAPAQPTLTSVPNAPLPTGTTSEAVAAMVTSSVTPNTSSTGLLQSGIGSAAVAGSVLPNLQYMLPGATQGAPNSRYTLYIDPQTRMPMVVPLSTMTANMQMAKQIQALQQHTAAAVAAAARGGITSASTAPQFSVIQNPSLSARAAAVGPVIGDGTATATKGSQSQSSADSGQIDGTQPLLSCEFSDNTSSLTLLSCDPNEHLLSQKPFQTVQSKQPLQDDYLSSNISDSSSAKGDVLLSLAAFDRPNSSSDCVVEKTCSQSFTTTNVTTGVIPQLDGADQESSAEEESEDSEEEDEIAGQGTADGDDDPLNSDDDDESVKSDDEDKFETENIIVCQFDKVTRTRILGKNRWKFHLKDGIMNIDGRDYVFQKATGEADW